MVRHLILFLMVFAMAFGTVNAFAKPGDAKPAASGPRKQLATIIYAGLGGAVLGLSTLSFYGRPQDKLANIAIGFAVGIITGTTVVTFNAATNPEDFYGPNEKTTMLPQLERESLKLGELSSSGLELQIAAFEFHF